MADELCPLVSCGSWFLSVHCGNDARKGEKMKRLFGLILVLALATIGAVSSQPSSIVGDWVQASPQVSWSFRADGTGLMERGQPATTARFNWQIEGGSLKLSTASGTAVVYQILSSPPDQLNITNRRLGLEYHLKRK